MDNNSNDFIKLDIPAIDKQHLKFFDMLQEYSDSQRNPKDGDLEKIIFELEDYLKRHFKTEEALMRKAGFEKIDEHIKEHKFFIEKVEEMRIDHNYFNKVLFDKITNFMKKWFLSHILQTDKEYKETVKTYLNSNK